MMISGHIFDLLKVEYDACHFKTDSLLILDPISKCEQTWEQQVPSQLRVQLSLSITLILSSGTRVQCITGIINIKIFLNYFMCKSFKVKLANQNM